MLPTRRDLRFHLSPDAACTWHGGDRHVSHFFNALSLFFPVGERFFIDSVRNFRGRIHDADLGKAVTAFIGQEAMHGREHADYNQLLAEAGLPAARLERYVEWLLARVVEHTTPQMQLSATIALEHFTAILANLLLTEPRLLEDADARYRLLWHWHALEETEHKAVAYDVWNTVTPPGPRGYLLRSGGLLAATAVFLPAIFYFHLSMIRADRAAPRSLRGYARVGNFLFGRPGLLRRMIPPWAAYFRPGFHPWQHDNRRLLARLDGFAAEVAGVTPRPQFARAA